MMRNREKKPRGITLVEVVITIALVSLILTALLALYASGQKYFFTESSQSDLLRDVRYVQNWISRDIKQAIRVLPNYDVYAASDNCLILEIPSVDSSGQIIDIDNDFDIIIYRLKPAFPERLERIVDAKDGVSSRSDTARDIVIQMSSFQLSSGGVSLSSIADFNEISSVDVTLVVRQNRLGRPYQETLGISAMLRNKLN